MYLAAAYPILIGSTTVSPNETLCHMTMPTIPTERTTLLENLRWKKFPVLDDGFVAFEHCHRERRAAPLIGLRQRIGMLL